MNNYTLQEYLGWSDKKYDSEKSRIKKICPLADDCPAKDLPESCSYFRLLMKGVYESEKT